MFQTTNRLLNKFTNCLVVSNNTKNISHWQLSSEILLWLMSFFLNYLQNIILKKQANILVGFYLNPSYAYSEPRQQRPTVLCCRSCSNFLRASFGSTKMGTTGPQRFPMVSLYNNIYNCITGLLLRSTHFSRNTRSECFEMQRNCGIAHVWVISTFWISQFAWCPSILTWVPKSSLSERVNITSLSYS